MADTKLRFGSFTAETTLPGLDALAEVARDKGVERHNQLRRGVSSSADIVREDDYLYIRFGKEMIQTNPEFNDDDDIVLDENQLARVMLFCVTEDQQYACESRQGVTAEDALTYLLEDYTTFQQDIVNEFSRDAMNEIYNDSDFIRGLKLKNIGIRSDSSVDSTLEDMLDGASANTEIIEFSTGSGEEEDDLASVELIDGFARLSDIKYIRTRDENGFIQEINQNGRYTYTHSNDVDDYAQAQNLRDAIEYMQTELI